MRNLSQSRQGAKGMRQMRGLAVLGKAEFRTSLQAVIPAKTGIHQQADLPASHICERIAACAGMTALARHEGAHGVSLRIPLP